MFLLMVTGLIVLYFWKKGVSFATVSAFFAWPILRMIPIIGWEISAFHLILLSPDLLNAAGMVLYLSLIHISKEQLDKIYEAVAPLYKERDKTYAEIKKQLHPYGVCGLDFKELEAQEKKYVKHYFKEQVLPLLSPQIVDANHPFPHLLNKEPVSYTHLDVYKRQVWILT